MATASSSRWLANSGLPDDPDAIHFARAYRTRLSFLRESSLVSQIDPPHNSSQAEPTSVPEETSANVPNDTGAVTTAEAVTEAPAAAPLAAEEESTVGTGTSMALGCIAGTVLLIVFGLIFLGLSTLL